MNKCQAYRCRLEHQLVANNELNRAHYGAKVLQLTIDMNDECFWAKLFIFIIEMYQFDLLYIAVVKELATFQS